MKAAMPPGIRALRLAGQIRRMEMVLTAGSPVRIGQAPARRQGRPAHPPPAITGDRASPPDGRPGERRIPQRAARRCTRAAIRAVRMPALLAASRWGRAAIHVRPPMNSLPINARDRSRARIGAQAPGRAKMEQTPRKRAGGRHQERSRDRRRARARPPHKARSQGKNKLKSKLGNRVKQEDRVKQRNRVRSKVRHPVPASAPARERAGTPVPRGTRTATHIKPPTNSVPMNARGGNRARIGAQVNARARMENRIWAKADGKHQERTRDSRRARVRHPHKARSPGENKVRSKQENRGKQRNRIRSEVGRRTPVSTPGRERSGTSISPWIRAVNHIRLATKSPLMNARGGSRARICAWAPGRGRLEQVARKRADGKHQDRSRDNRRARVRPLEGARSQERNKLNQGNRVRSKIRHRILARTPGRGRAGVPARPGTRAMQAATMVRGAQAAMLDGAVPPLLNH